MRRGALLRVLHAALILSLAIPNFTGVVQARAPLPPAGDLISTRASGAARAVA